MLIFGFLKCEDFLSSYETLLHLCIGSVKKGAGSEIALASQLIGNKTKQKLYYVYVTFSLLKFIQFTNISRSFIGLESTIILLAYYFH